jgi:ABC-2 type transport system permease protein
MHQLRAEQLLFWRSREAAFFIFIFPLILFVLLASVYTGTYLGRPAAWSVFAGLVAYGGANTGFAGLALLLIGRRELGILKRIRSTPLPSATYLAAALTSMVLVFALQVVVLWVLGKLLKDIPFPHRLGSFVVTTLLGCAAFAGLGLAATALIRSLEGSSGAINAVLLPMAFLSGGFGPTAHYPTVLRKIGDVLPLKYFVQLLYTVYLREKSLWSRPGALAVLAVWGVVGAVIAARRFRWEPVEG